MAATVADEAFERLYARYGREVYRYALALLRNPSEAEDVTQTTFLNAYRALRAGAQPRRPHNWLIAIAHNACRSRVRVKMRRPKEVPLDDVVEQLVVPETERPNIAELVRTLGRLPSNQRAAITMRELEGRSYVDIAESLGVTVPAAEALIGRARRTLRAHASAFRGLILFPLQRALRRLTENGEAAGGAVGGVAAAKIAALLVVGAIGGGVGIAAAGSSHEHSVSLSAPAAAAQQLGSGKAPARSIRRPPGVAAGTAIPAGASAPAAPAGTTTTITAASSAAAAAPTAVETAAAAGTTLNSPVTSVVSQVTKAATTVSSALPTVTAPTVSVTTPTVSTPVATVTVPTVTVPSVTVPTTIP
jgi:RNA polymerase sigma factor (sigma-70 family)